MQVKLKTLLLAGSIGLGLLGMAATGMLIYFTIHMHQVGRRLDDAVADVFSAEELGRAIRAFNRQAILEQATGEADYRTRRDTASAAIKRWSLEISKHIDAPEEQRLVGEVERRIESYLQTDQQAVTRAASPVQRMQDDEAAVRASGEALEDLSVFNRDQVFRTRQQVESEERVLQQFAWLIAGLLMLGIGAIVTLTAALFYRPLRQVLRGIARYGSGDDTARVPGAGCVEVRELAATFNDMADAIKRQRESHWRFLASVAHDLRNPLAAMHMAADLLSEGGVTIMDSELLGTIKRQATDLDRMVGDLLDTSRVEGDRLDLRLAAMDLRQPCTDAVSLFRSISPAHTVRLELPPAPIIATFDCMRVGQILNNLLSNAIKYSPRGGDVVVRLSADSDVARIAVIDQGLGVATPDRDSIFTPFRRAAATKGTVPGTGLGLSVARRLARAHGGDLNFESGSSGVGSIFTFTVPLALPRVPELASPKLTAHPSGSAVEGTLH